MAHTSVILALFPAERAVRPLRRAARRLPGGGTPAAQMHVTLAYLGDVDTLAGRRDAVMAALLSFVRADDTRLIRLPVVGVRRMPHIDDGQQAVAAAIGGDGVRAFRADLVAALEAQGVPIDERWPEFLPHLTLGYVPATAPTPPLRVPRVTIPAGEICLCWGDERIVLPLLGTEVKAAAAAERPVVGATVKPFASRAQQRFAFATGQPWAEEWAEETDFRNLPARARAKIRREARSRQALRVKVKALDNGRSVVWAMLTKAGERIAGQLCRDKTGKYVNCNSKEATQESKDKLRDAEREQKRAARDEEKQAARRANEAKVGADAGLGANLSDALMEFASPDENITLAPQNAAALMDAGLVEQNPDGSYRISGAGRSYVAAARAGDVGRARDALGRGAERVARRQATEQRQQERAAARQQRDAERERKRAEREAKRSAPKKGGGGGKGKEPKKSAAPKPGAARAITRPSGGGGARGRAPGAPQAGGGQTADVLRRADAAIRDRQAQARRDAADASRQQERQARAQATAAREAQRQQERQARDTERAAAQAARQARETRRLDSLETRARRGDDLTQAERDRLTEAGRAEETPQGWRLTSKVRRRHTYWRAFRSERKAGRTPSEARAAAREARRRRDLARIERQRARLIGWLPAQGALSVFKTRDGRLRWLAFSSNGYRDKDGEHVSVKALAADVARTDADGQYGPLRWWHEGEPNPLSPDAPWGPGVDLGWCDFSAMSGPCLVESGTFADDRIGLAIARKADQYAVSLGFFHPINEPDRDGVFHHIRRFERSLAPRDRVSNPFTSFHVPAAKGSPMNTAKKTQLKALLGDSYSDAELDALIARGVAATQTAAKAAGVALKAEADAPTVYQLPDGSPGIIVDGKIVALKALPATAEKAPMDPAEMVEAGETEAADGAAEAAAEDVEAEAEEAEDDTAYAADLPVDAFRAMLREEFAAALKPLVAQMKMGEKMEGMLKMMGEEMKGYMSGVGQKAEAGEASVAELKAKLAEQERQVADLQKRLKALDGDTPAAIARASRSAATVVSEVAAPVEATVKTGDGQPAYVSTFDGLAGWLEGQGQTPAAD